MFTTIGIALALVILFSYNIYNRERLADNMDVIGTRISTMNSFINDMENNIGNVIFVVGFRSLLSLEDYLMINNDFLTNLGTDIDTAFSEVFQNGTVNSQEMSLMINNTFTNWTTKIESEANKTDIALNITINSVSISQSDPWSVDIFVNVDIDIDDKKNTASWNIDNMVYSKNMNITGFVDPLYLVNTDGRINNTITRSSSFPGSLSSHYSNHHYIAHTDAPDYLNRFDNDLTASSNGIESLADSAAISALGLGWPAAKTAVDYIYFDTSSSTTDCEITDITEVWLDTSGDDHQTFYGATCV